MEKIEIDGAYITYSVNTKDEKESDLANDFFSFCDAGRLIVIHNIQGKAVAKALRTFVHKFSDDVVMAEIPCPLINVNSSISEELIQALKGAHNLAVIFELMGFMDISYLSGLDKYKVFIYRNNKGTITAPDYLTFLSGKLVSSATVDDLDAFCLAFKNCKNEDVIRLIDKLTYLLGEGKLSESLHTTLSKARSFIGKQEVTLDE